jgi:hypothetical protein
MNYYKIVCLSLVISTQKCHLPTSATITNTNTISETSETQTNQSRSLQIYYIYYMYLLFNLI